MFIYKITNLINGKLYIGQTVTTVEKRFKKHFSKYSENSSYKSAMYYAMKKYGKDNFKVETIDIANNIDDLNLREIYWIFKLSTISPNGYNLKAGGSNGRLSEETKNKISESNKGKIVSLETRKRLSESHKGHKVTDETKYKLSQSNKGKPPHQNTILASVKKSAKNFTVLNPIGEIINIYNMADFCRKNNLLASKMSNVVTGKIAQHKGWENNNEN